jgi:glycosyltransferase involved in cell wall biosynthesis
MVDVALIGNAKGTVGVYRTIFPFPSEVFIIEQASALTSYMPVILTRTKLSETNLACVAISDSDIFSIKQRLFSLTRFPALFGRNEMISSLDIIHSHFGSDGIYAMPLADKLKIPLVVTFHGCDVTCSKKTLIISGRPSAYQFLIHERQLKKKASAIIAVSDFIYHKLLDKGYPAEKLHLHYIGVDIDKFTPSDTKPLDRYILCVGRHDPKKGIDTLLRAFALIERKHADVKLLLVGNGILSETLREIAGSLGILNRVEFLGVQPHKEVVKLMQGAEVFALPSQKAESGDCEALGIVFNEASACGVPIVSTWHGGIPEAVVDGETGFLAKEKDCEALATHIDYLLSNREQARMMGRRGREYVCEKFDIRKQTAKLETIYDQVLSNWQKRGRT